MRLTAYTDFSLRVLMYLAVRPDQRPTIAQIATSYGISKNHLMKVVYELGLAGYVGTVRGKNGGLQLARAPRDIVLGEVVRRTEPDMLIVPCFEPATASCVISPACKLRGVLQSASAAFLAVLDDYTLADLVANRSVLADLLVQAPPAVVAAPRRTPAPVRPPRQ